MSINSEREVTNKSFKGKMAEIISVLSGETYTPVPAANDSETLNCKTFEYFMNILKENIGGGGGGSSLPEVTSEDNGDVLQVIEGAWGKGPAPAADNDYIISANLVQGSGALSISSEITISDIIAANTAGKNIKLEITVSEEVLYVGHMTYLFSGEDPEAGFLIYLNNFGTVVCNKNGWAIGS